MKGLVLRTCAPLEAKITARGCQMNRARNLFACSTCAGLGSAVDSDERTGTEERGDGLALGPESAVRVVARATQRLGRS